MARMRPGYLPPMHPDKQTITAYESYSIYSCLRFIYKRYSQFFS